MQRLTSDRSERIRRDNVYAAAYTISKRRILTPGRLADELGRSLNAIYLYMMRHPEIKDHIGICRGDGLDAVALQIRCIRVVGDIIDKKQPLDLKSIMERGVSPVTLEKVMSDHREVRALVTTYKYWQRRAARKQWFAR